MTITKVRVQTHSNPERDDGGEDDGGQEVEGELVVACGNAPEVLEATERCFDPPAITIAPFIVPDRGFFFFRRHHKSHKKPREPSPIFELCLE